MPVVKYTTATIIESNNIGKFFKHIAQYVLVVYKECRYSILPSQIKSYIQHSYYAKYKKAKLIVDKVYSQASLIKYTSKLEVLSQVIKPIYQLLVYKDRLIY